MNNKYPEFFFAFSGSTKESVKTIGAPGTAWSCNNLVDTRLLNNLSSLADKMKTECVAPPCIFLVGGPGNGKTGAAEYFLMKLYGGDTIPEYEKSNGHLVFRKRISNTIDGIVVIEDATTVTHASLRADIKDYALRADDNSSYRRYAYIACVNRGVLADCINESDEDQYVTTFMAALSDVVSVGETSPNMWPLAGNRRFQRDSRWSDHIASVYVWPMDAESLIDKNLFGGETQNTPGYRLIKSIFEQADCSSCDVCPHRDLCPFRENLLSIKEGKGLLDFLYCLHSFEIVTGNKILFRDILAICSVVFAGDEREYKIIKGDRTVEASPCEWVAYHANLVKSGNAHESLASSFLLTSRRYNQILFGDYSEFSSKDIQGPQGLRKKMASIKDEQEFKPIVSLLKSINELNRRWRSVKGIQKLIHQDFASRMDIANEEDYDPLEQIEIGFCSSTNIGVARTSEFIKPPATVSSFFVNLQRIEDRLGNCSYEVSSDRAELCRRGIQILQVIGSRVAKREVGGEQPLVKNFADVDEYEALCFNPSKKSELDFVKKPLKKILSLDGDFVSSVTRSIGQTQISPRYILNIEAKINASIELIRNSTLPVRSDSPVDPTPIIAIKLACDDGGQTVRLPLTFALFYALRKVKEGLSVSCISEQTFVSLNLIASRLLGIISHHAQEVKFSFPSIKNGTFDWLGGELSREENIL